MTQDSSNAVFNVLKNKFELNVVNVFDKYFK